MGADSASIKAEVLKTLNFFKSGGIDATGTGYVRFADGIQICYGSVGSDNSGICTITYPVAFISAPQLVASVVGTINEAQLRSLFAYVNSSSSSYGNIYCRENGVAPMITCHYLAVGRWK